MLEPQWERAEDTPSWTSFRPCGPWGSQVCLLPGTPARAAVPCCSDELGNDTAEVTWLEAAALDVTLNHGTGSERTSEPSGVTWLWTSTEPGARAPARSLKQGRGRDGPEREGQRGHREPTDQVALPWAPLAREMNGLANIPVLLWGLRAWPRSQGPGNQQGRPRALGGSAARPSLEQSPAWQNHTCQSCRCVRISESDCALPIASYSLALGALFQCPSEESPGLSPRWAGCQSGGSWVLEGTRTPSNRASRVLYCPHPCPVFLHRPQTWPCPHPGWLLSCPWRCNGPCTHQQGLVLRNCLLTGICGQVSVA